MIRVRTGARLHFGLIDPFGLTDRRYGGAGVMVDAPRIEVTIEPACSWSVAGPLAARAEDFARRATAGELPPARLEVRSDHPDHVGLGTGTQLGLAVATALDRLQGGRSDVPELARRVGRGERSAIGIWGFDAGGFIVDEGRGPTDAISPLRARCALPSTWRFVLVLAESERGLSGAAERRAFEQGPATDARTSRELERLIDEALLPAARRADLRNFGAALTEYGARAGELFVEAQGGIYASPRVAEIVTFALEHGASGAGQSSWGPATYAAIDGDEDAAALATLLRERFGLAGPEVVVARALDRGALVEAD